MALENAPIFYALAQVRFNALLALEQYLPKIQDGLRRNGYPDFERGMVAAINFAIGGGAVGEAQSMPIMQPQAKYSFSNSSKTSGFVLDATMMMFHTTAYESFDAFSEAFIMGVTLLQDQVGLTYTDRIGIRYLDAIFPPVGEDLSLYLVPSVMGIHVGLEPRVLVHGFSETRTAEGNTTLVSRSVIMNQSEEKNAAFPADLGSITLKLKDRFTKVKGMYAVIDTDCWLEEREDFNISGLKKRVATLYSDLKRSFDLTVTPHAIEVWK